MAPETVHLQPDLHHPQFLNSFLCYLVGNFFLSLIFVSTVSLKLISVDAVKQGILGQLLIDNKPPQTYVSGSRVWAWPAALGLEAS